MIVPWADNVGWTQQQQRNYPHQRQHSAIKHLDRDVQIQRASGLDYQRKKKLKALWMREYRQRIKQDPTKDRLYKQRQHIYDIRHRHKMKDIFARNQSGGSGSGGQV